MDEGPRSSRFTSVVCAALLIFTGVGCVSQLAPPSSTFESEDVATSSSRQELADQKIGQGCRDVETVPEGEVNDFLTATIGKDVQMLVRSQLRQKAGEGWDVRLLCTEPSRREIALSFLNTKGNIPPKLYAASPDDPSPTGTASMLAVMTWPAPSTVTGTSLILRTAYSHPVGIRGNGDVDTFRAISVQDGVVYGRVDTGTLTADVHFLPGVHTIVKDICTMDPYADTPDLNERCYPNQ